MEEKIKLFGANIGNKVKFDGSVFTLDGIIAEDYSFYDLSNELITLTKGTVILSGDFSGIGHMQRSGVSIKECEIVNPH